MEEGKELPGRIRIRIQIQINKMNVKKHFSKKVVFHSSSTRGVNEIACKPFQQTMDLLETIQRNQVEQYNFKAFRRVQVRYG